jgi:hypothetical protein
MPASAVAKLWIGGTKEKPAGLSRRVSVSSRQKLGHPQMIEASPASLKKPLITAWITMCDSEISRPEAIRRLVDLALKARK